MKAMNSQFARFFIVHIAVKKLNTYGWS